MTLGMPDAGDYQRRFGVTFTVSFFLTVLIAPFFLANTFPDEAHGLVLGLLLLGGILSIAPLFLESLVIAAIVFFTLYGLISSRTGSRAAFIVSATFAAFISAVLTLLVHVGFSPFEISFSPDGWWFGSTAGMVAAGMTFLVAAMQVAVPESDE